MPKRNLIHQDGALSLGMSVLAGCCSAFYFYNPATKGGLVWTSQGPKVTWFAIGTYGGFSRRTLVGILVSGYFSQQLFPVQNGISFAQKSIE
jgi:hypothetical protein